MTAENSFFYANGLELGASPFDMNLKFIRSGPAGTSQLKDGTTPTEIASVELESILVCMSPSHFKAILPSLVTAVLNYEKSFGVIPLPPVHQASWAELVKEKK